MAKEFKTWDKAFTKEEIQEELKVWNALIRSNIVNYWPYRYTQPSPDVARHAVYVVEGHRDWQRFRVSLKGLSTRNKLRRLEAYRLCNKGSEWTNTRVNNYIGALKRGGLLDQQLFIIK